jgi:hypothetical protein
MSLFKAIPSVIVLTVSACGVSESNDVNSGSYGAPFFRIGIYTMDSSENLTAGHRVYMEVGDAETCEYIRQTYDESVAYYMQEYGEVDEGTLLYGDAFTDASGTCWSRRPSSDDEGAGQEFVYVVQDERRPVRILVSRERDFVPDSIEPARQWEPPAELWEDVRIDPRDYDLSTNAMNQRFDRYATVIQVRLTADGYEIEAAVVRANDLGSNSAPPIDREIPSFED